jgi:RNA polymerase subunit RPABC4/transcription elongation factor Spt4
MDQQKTDRGTRICVSCGRPIEWDAEVCPYCGHTYGKKSREDLYERKLPILNGILLFGAAICMMIFGEFGLFLIPIAVGLLSLWRKETGLVVLCGAFLSGYIFINYLGSYVLRDYKSTTTGDIAGIIGLIVMLSGLLIINHNRNIQKDIIDSEKTPKEKTDSEKGRGTDASSKCSSCGGVLDPKWKVCPFCGKTIKSGEQERKTQCPSCGKPIKPEWKKCPYCATNL